MVTLDRPQLVLLLLELLVLHHELFALDERRLELRLHLADLAVARVHAAVARVFLLHLLLQPLVVALQILVDDEHRVLIRIGDDGAR